LLYVVKSALPEVFMLRLARVPFFVSLALVAASCSSDPATPAEGDAACDNLDASTCLFPFPSDFFRKPGGPYGQAFHLDFGASMPVSEMTEERMSPEPFKRNDGYPVVPAITFTLEGASAAGAPPLDDIGASLRPESKTLLIDAETFELMPHWTELDYLSEESGVRVLQIRVANGLRHGRRYVVAVRGIVDDAGAIVSPPAGFAALRDGESSRLAGIEDRRARFDAEVFSVIERLGVARADLQLAWDFTTASEVNATSRLLTMRDRLYAAIGDDGPEYTVTGVEQDPEGPEGTIASIITATARVPSFVLPAEEGGYARRLRLDEQGLPAIDGFEEVAFKVQVPRIARTEPGKVAVLQYGHGFLGSDREANNAWLREWANRQGFLILSCDMQGMNTTAGVNWFVRLPQDATTLSYISEEPLQGVINHLALQRLMKGRFLADPNVDRAGEPLYDPTRLYYHGNSQGGTMGNLVAMASRDVTRSVLGVPGVSIGFILARASQWQEQRGSFQSAYSDPYVFASIMSLVQVGWDKSDGINFAPRYADLPGGPPKQVLLQTALEDSQVNNDVTRLLARLYEAKLIAPATREVWGLEVAEPPITNANGYLEVDYGVPERTRTHWPAPSETDTHGLPRKQHHVQDQGWHFLETGEIIHTCDGVCDPE
jgi:hypothetical protein